MVFIIERWEDIRGAFWYTRDSPTTILASAFAIRAYYELRALLKM